MSPFKSKYEWSVNHLFMRISVSKLQHSWSGSCSYLELIIYIFCVAVFQTNTCLFLFTLIYTWPIDLEFWNSSTGSKTYTGWWEVQKVWPLTPKAFGRLQVEQYNVLYLLHWCLWRRNKRNSVDQQIFQENLESPVRKLQISRGQWLETHITGAQDINFTKVYLKLSWKIIQPFVPGHLQQWFFSKWLNKKKLSSNMFALLMHQQLHNRTK